MILEEDLYFEIVDHGDSVFVTPLKLSHPTADEEWDRYWIDCLVRVKASCFYGEYHTQLMIHDFINLRKQIDALYDNLAGTANFEPLERGLCLFIQGDGVGHFELTVTARENFDAKLVFTLSFDQTIIKTLLRQLNNIIARYQS
ncbi:hypothetical protein LT679_15700 [Mucilaginibacter roseus]|uniref:DUF1795 domain-containing protein n=1 Tax=Mucilaginibacter roseus TaxID=1528868 RepID=A0ABS8U8R7_9SPHI|nr:hypothetical protein [Mucilaginibacter roseus]MCD8742058.1 hypothetical protein [Mucilaginibacter roseus]